MTITFVLNTLFKTVGNSELLYFAHCDFFFLHLVVEQSYQLRVNDEFVLKGNTAVLKCIVPSFIGDFLEIIEWVSDFGESFIINKSDKGLYYYIVTYILKRMKSSVTKILHVILKKKKLLNHKHLECCIAVLIFSCESILRSSSL